jgi:hypothetical protein
VPQALRIEGALSRAIRRGKSKKGEP